MSKRTLLAMAGTTALGIGSWSSQLHAQCDSPDGAPANDCATDPTVAEIGDVFTFSNVDASTDGPNGDSSVCPFKLNIGNDLWWIVRSPGSGYLTATMCNGTDFFAVIEVYALGDSPDFDPELLPEYQIGCEALNCDIGSGNPGASIVTITGPEEGQWFLFRAGGAVDSQTGLPSTGNGEIAFEFLNVIYNTGSVRQLFNNNTGGLSRLGLSSGFLGFSLPQRWIAAPFSVPVPTAEGTDSWLIQTIAANGFSGEFDVNETMEWIIWERDASNAAPVDFDQVVSGSVPFPAPIADPFDPTGVPYPSQHDITTDFVLEPGDYYLTVYAANSSNVFEPANFAWFCNAPDGINLVDAQGPFTWRSRYQPVPGFERYTLSAQWQQQDGLDPNDVCAVVFKILGVPYSSGKPPILGDLNGDGVVNGADLTILLGCWGSVTNPACSPADLNADGVVSGADLTIQLGNWTS